MTKNEDKAKPRRQILQLTRLERLTDVVYAIVIWRIFMLIPRPGEGGWHWDSIGGFLADNVMTFILVFIGLVFTIIYWTQNNVLSGNLARTDGRHTSFAILQIFFLLLFLYALRIGVVFDASPATRAFESVTAALVGLAGSWGWTYAKKDRRLLQSEVTNQQANDLGDRILAEPLTALFTIPFAFTPILWELSWLVYPVAVKLLKRRRRVTGPGT